MKYLLFRKENLIVGGSEFGMWAVIMGVSGDLGSSVDQRLELSASVQHPSPGKSDDVQLA